LFDKLGYGAPPTYLPNQTNAQPYIAQTGLDPWYYSRMIFKLIFLFIYRPVNVPAYPQEYETHFPLGSISYSFLHHLLLIYVNV